MWGNDETQFFYQLDPEQIFQALEKVGYKPTGRCMALNSMENRVYEVEIELDKNLNQRISPSDHFKIAKFYRPGRWNEEQIREEHTYLNDLVENEIPVIAPLKINGETLFKIEESGIYYCLYDKVGGRAPDELTEENIEILGRLIARIHQVGKEKKAKHRLHLNPHNYGLSNLKYLTENNFYPLHLVKQFEKVIKEICEISEDLFKDLIPQRIHGDCHLGNLIKRDNKFFILDFDDMCIGPPVQDIWLLNPGRDRHLLWQRQKFIEAYRTMADFNESSIKLIEPLRALRYIHYSSWIARRWDDPAFKTNFPHFGTDAYWEISLRDLEEQLTLIKGSH